MEFDERCMLGAATLVQWRLVWDSYMDELQVPKIECRPDMIVCVEIPNFKMGLAWCLCLCLCLCLLALLLMRASHKLANHWTGCWFQGDPIEQTSHSRCLFCWEFSDCFMRAALLQEDHVLLMGTIISCASHGCFQTLDLIGLIACTKRHFSAAMHKAHKESCDGDF